MAPKSVKHLETRRSPLSDVDEPYITVTDIKHYFYCPLIVYYDRVLHYKPIMGSQQEEGRKIHRDYMTKEHRRKDAIFYSPEFRDAEKLFQVTLYSKKLKLMGTIDCIIKTKNNEYIPIEYKNMNSNKGKIWIHHKYQLVGYALLLEEAYHTVVKRGYLNYLPDEKIIQQKITPTMKTHVRKALEKILMIIEGKEIPRVNISSKCRGGCGYTHLCQ